MTTLLDLPLELLAKCAELLPPQSVIALMQTNQEAKSLFGSATVWQAVGKHHIEYHGYNPAEMGPPAAYGAYVRINKKIVLLHQFMKEYKGFSEDITKEIQEMMDAWEGSNVPEKFNLINMVNTQYRSLLQKLARFSKDDYPFPFEFAITKGYLPLINDFYAIQATVRLHNQNLFLTEMRKGNIDVLLVLIKNNIPGMNNKEALDSALSIAVNKGNMPIIEALLNSEKLILNEADMLPVFDAAVIDDHPAILHYLFKHPRLTQGSKLLPELITRALTRGYTEKTSIMNVLRSFQSIPSIMKASETVSIEKLKDKAKKLLTAFPKTLPIEMRVQRPNSTYSPFSIFSAPPVIYDDAKDFEAIIQFVNAVQTEVAGDENTCSTIKPVLQKLTGRCHDVIAALGPQRPTPELVHLNMGLGMMKVFLEQYTQNRIKNKNTSAL